MPCSTNARQLQRAGNPVLYRRVLKRLRDMIDKELSESGSRTEEEGEDGSKLES